MATAKKAASKKPAAKKAAPAKNAKNTAAKPAAEKPVKVAKEKPAPKPKPEKIEANGQVRPRAGGLTAKVWEAAEAITKQNKTTATRAEVMAWGAANGMEAGTVATQYGRWRRFIGQPGRLPSAAKPAKAEKPAKGAKAAAAATA